MKKLGILLAFFVASPAFSEIKSDLNLGFAYGPEPIVAVPIPNFEINFFPFEGSDFYFGLNANLFFSLGHVGVDVGHLWKPIFLEVSLSQTFLAVPQEGDPQAYTSLSINPKMGIRTDFEEFSLGGMVLRNLNFYAVVGYSQSLVKTNSLRTGNAIIEAQSMFPMNVEIGITTRLFG